MNIFVGLLILFSFIFGSFYGLDEYNNRDKFKVGDIVETVYENEFERDVYYNIIVKVGEKNYLTHVSYSTGWVYSTFRVEPKILLNKKELAKNPPEIKIPEYLLEEE